jgi:hypothetical protein
MKGDIMDEQKELFEREFLLKLRPEKDETVEFSEFLNRFTQEVSQVITCGPNVKIYSRAWYEAHGVQMLPKREVKE